MAGKRLATSELNHNNWNQEDEPEEAGSFSKASDDIIKNRIMKVAKRRSLIGSPAASEGEKKGAFVNFGGFTKAPATPSSAFGFLSKLTKAEQPKTNGLNDPAGAASTIFKLPEKTSSKNSKYYAKLKGLNESVSSWIKKHVDANPFLNLTPVFRDYEKYLEEIESSNQDEQVTHKITETKTITKTETQTYTFKPEEYTPGSKLKASFAAPSVETAEKPDEQKAPQFGFGFGPNCSSPKAPTFSFGKVNAQPSTSSAGFSFGSDSSKPFMFSNVAKPADTEGGKESIEADEDEPPKVEFTPVIEEGHIHTVRCKVFVKKDGKYGDRGMGNLFLKPVPDSSKVQLIVRADTSLGNLLCNFILSSNIPMQCVGTKDVMLICIPLPDSKPPPVPILFRVKSAEEAKELLQTLEKHKQ